MTNLEAGSRAVARFCNQRGRAEQRIQKGKQAVKMTRLSCHHFRSNEVHLWLSVMAYNLGNPWPGRPPGRVLPRRIDHWGLTSLPRRLMKTGGRLTKHSRYYWLMLAESHVTRRLFGTMVHRIAALPVATGQAEERVSRQESAQKEGGVRRSNGAAGWKGIQLTGSKGRQ